MGAFDHLEWTYDGAFEQLFGLGRGEFEQKFCKKYKCPGGCPGGMLKLRFDWYIIVKHSAIGKHLLEVHGDKNLVNENQFRVLKKCHGKFDCLVYEMLFIKELDNQSDSISAKRFVQFVAYFCYFSFNELLFFLYL